MTGISAWGDADVLQQVQCATFELKHTAVLGMSGAVLGVFVKREER